MGLFQPNHMLQLWYATLRLEDLHIKSNGNYSPISPSRAWKSDCRTFIVGLAYFSFNDGSSPLVNCLVFTETTDKLSTTYSIRATHHSFKTYLTALWLPTINRKETSQ